MKKVKAVAPNSSWETIDFYKAKPSKESESGYKGRVGIYEVFEMTDSIKALILKGASADDVNKIAKKEGMISVVEDSFIKAAQGYTSIEEILRVTKE